MVKIGLQVRAQLENVTTLRPDGEDFRWYLKLKCVGCGEVPDHWQYVTLTDKVPLKGGRGEANAVIKCKLCSRENSIDILSDSISSYAYADYQGNKFTTIVAFDCRGIEPVDYDPRVGWAANGYKLSTEDDDTEDQETGTVFNEIDLSDKEWADFDEKSGESTFISDFECKFVKIK
jgi:hypothetical protein